jgi:hypothetical protein
MGNASSAVDFHVGDKVWVPVPLGRASGTVIEERGPLGRGGRNLYRVAVPNHPYSIDVFLVDEEEIEHLTESEQAALQERLDPRAVKDFLIHGGLFSILARNSPAPVWLRRGPRGNITFTYIEGYSATGGEAPPALALHGEKVFSQKREAVVRFLKSFGLTGPDAEETVMKVGVAP